MTLPIALLCLLLAVALLGWAFHRATDLFCIEVTNGTTRFTRGRVPQRLLQEMTEVVRRSRVTRGRIRARVEGGKPRLLVDGDFSEGTTQQLRNVLGTFRLAQIRAGRRPKA